MRIATSEIEDDAPVDDGKDKAAQALGSKRTAEKWAEIAQTAVTKWWDTTAEEKIS